MPVIFVVFLVAALRLAAEGGVLAIGLVVLPAIAVALAEFERRRLRSASFGYLDARVAPGEMTFVSARGAVWVGVGVIALGGVSLLIFLIVLPDLAEGFARRGGTGLLLVAALVSVGIGVRILWLALASSSTVVIDSSGVAVGEGRRRRVVRWEAGIFADAHGGKLTLASGSGSVSARVLYLRTDPVIVAGIINRCSADPALRARLGGEMIDALKSEEPWRRNRPTRANS
ncbi:hypothetical protein [Microbacterium sp. CGR1]|uniref:hypothetical protein n=1 Tax=Microbacterium sp. CGR1 TaxID=1696072 RepID=UPI003DA23798